MKKLIIILLFAIPAYGADTTMFQKGVSEYTATTHIELYENDADANQDSTSNEAYFSFVTDPAAARHPIVYFDISSIPSGDTITSATLRFYGTDADNGSTVDFDVAASKRTVVFSQATWNVYSTGNSWQTAGGSGANDRQTAEDTVQIDCSGPQDSVDFDVTTSVRNFHSEAWTNLGWVFTGVAEGSGDANYWQFHTENAASASDRPLLIIIHGSEPTEGNRRRRLLLEDVQ